MALATAAAIRDRIHTLIEGITPASHSEVGFKRIRSEGTGSIAEWAEKNLQACLRRFQARQISTDDPPQVSSVTQERVMLRIQIRVAYPQSGRFGGDNALDRDDAINQDWRDINYKIGMYGRANFSSTHDCTPLPARMEMERGVGVDFMVIDAEYEYLRSTT